MIGWIYYALCMLFATVVLWPLGLVLVGAACVARAWVLPSTSSPASIKPLPGRSRIDVWSWSWMNAVYGNPEDGVTGTCAFGSWLGPFNDLPPSRWLAFVWSGLRNWANGFNYLTWRSASMPPLLIKPYTLFGKERQLKLGWQQLPASDGWVGPYRCRMVCSP